MLADASERRLELNQLETVVLFLMSSYLLVVLKLAHKSYQVPCLSRKRSHSNKILDVCKASFAQSAIGCITPTSSPSGRKYDTRR